MIKPCKSCLKSGTQFCKDCEYEAMREVLLLAKEALEDLGACSYPDCDEPGCSHVLPKTKKLLDGEESGMFLDSNGNNEFIGRLLDQQPCPPEFQQVINDDFWSII